MLVAEQHDRGTLRGTEHGERRCVLGEFYGHDLCATRLLLRDPRQLRRRDPVDVRTPRQRVTVIQRIAVVGGVWHRHTTADGVAGSQQRPEVRSVGDPQRCYDKVFGASSWC